MLQSPDGSPPFVSDATECAVGTSPASTFKIPHALIALETGVVSDAFDLVAWDGSDQPFEVWRREHSLDSAIESSVVWFFRRTAGLIGRDRMLEHLTSFAYSADSFDDDVTSFWLNGDLVVSPAEQLRFLQRLVRYELPVDRRHVEVVESALLMPAGTITNAAGTFAFALAWPGAPLVRAKTGYTTVGGEHVSWLVGSIETGERPYVFVSRVRTSQDLPGSAGIDLALGVLNEHAP